MDILFEKKIHSIFLWINNQLKRSNIATRPISSEIEIIQEYNLPRVERIDNWLEAELYAFEKKFTEVHFPKAILYRLTSVHLAGDKAYPYKNGKLIGYCHEVRDADSTKIRRPIPQIAKKISEPIFHLTGNNFENRGHFMVQHAARLYIALDWLLSHPEIKILTAYGQSQWQSKYLKFFDINPDRIIETGKGTLECKEVYYVPMFYGNNLLPPREIIEGMANIYINKRKAELSGIVFLSRKDAPDRHLLNEDELVGVLEKIMGSVKVIYLKDYSLEEQVQIFTSAKLIVGPYGQSFSNLLFCRNKKVLILCPNHCDKIQHWSQSFRDIGLQLGSQATRLIADTEYLENRNWVFPKEKFEDELHRYLALVNSPSH